jgi:long-chain fatty acid transport protein
VIAGNPWFVAPFTYSGDVSSHIDIVSVALKYRWDNPAPAPALYHK